MRFSIPEDDILLSRRREVLRSYISFTGWALYRKCNVFPVRYELGFYIQRTTFFLVTAVKYSDLT
jgi:hypothetical protein